MQKMTLTSALAGSDLEPGATLNARQRARRSQDQICAAVREWVASGSLRPGDPLPPERALAGQFAATRKTVREALVRLLDEALIEKRPGSGSYIRRPAQQSRGPAVEAPSVSPIDSIEARGVFEPAVYDLVVARATEDDFGRMRDRLAAMEASPDQASFAEAGYAFRLEVVRATRNPLLVAMYEMLIAARAKAGWSRLSLLNDRPELRGAQTEINRRLLAALQQRDGAVASAVSRNHLSEMIATLSAFSGTHPSGPSEVGARNRPA
jgi:GntR family transcriptional repressor for pyruvate dehydrogenase complex